jgi:tetratricopeptide (TPR) repeat protein
LLLDEITPQAGDDDVARLWYRATTAWLAAAYRLADLKAHLEKAASVFGDDAVTAFDRGCLYETFASRRVRAIIDTTPQQTFTFDVPTRRASLTEASRHFRRAVELNPEMVDARLRLGRVLVLMGREDDGVTELQRALADASRPEWQYDASLMLGRAAGARGRLDAARQRFEAAEALYPRAQAPKLALARLAGSQGEVRRQADRVSAALSLDRERQQDDDPWWTYHQGIGRDAGDLLERLRRRVREERR